MNDLLRDDTPPQEFYSDDTLFLDSDDEPAVERSTVPESVFDNPVNPFERDDTATTTPAPAVAATVSRQGGSRSARKKPKSKVKATKVSKGGASAVTTNTASSTDNAGAPHPKASAPWAKALGFFGFGPAASSKTKGKGHTKGGLKLTRRNSAVKQLMMLLGALLALNLLLFVMVANKAGKGDIATEVAKQNEEQGKGFPKGDAVQFAGQALRVWGTWDEGDQLQHRTYLAPYLTSGMDEQGGWNGKGKQVVEYASVNPEPTVVDKNRAVVSASYQIQDGSWRCVAIPVFAYHGNGTTGPSEWAFALSGNPAPMPCLPRTGADDVDNFTLGANLEEDETTNRSLQDSFFPGFMAAWGASDRNGLNQYAVPGLSMTGLNGSVASSPKPSIGDVHLYYPSGSSVQQNTTYKAVVEVQWTLQGSDATVKSTYVLPLKKTGDRWYAAGEPQVVAQDAEAGGGTGLDVAQPGQDATPGGYASSQVSPSSAPATVNPGSSPSASSSKSGKPSASDSKKPSPSSSK